MTTIGTDTFRVPVFLAEGNGINLSQDGVSQALTVAITDALQSTIDSKAAASHTHAISDVTGLEAALNQTDLGLASAVSLPLGDITLPGVQNNPLGLKYRWNGSKVITDRLPYDAIDFTKWTTCNNYYVNYSTGNNASAGTSSGTAWKTYDYAIANAVSPAIIHIEDEWVGYLSAAGTAGKIVSGYFKIKSASPSGRTIFAGMRESWTVGSWSWVASGSGGAYVSGPTAAAQYFRAQFDSNYRDENGIPMPLRNAGSQAACESTPGTYFWDAGASKLYVNMIDGRTPDPADGWIYAQSAYRFEIQQALSSDGTVLLENIDFCYNNGTAAGAACRYRPQTTGGTNTCRLGLKGCRAYGAAGNGFENYDGGITVYENCIAAYNHRDGLNDHSFVTTGSKGNYMTVYQHDCTSYHNGTGLWADQATQSTSCNAFTAHDSINIIRSNCVGYYTNGAVFADVNGVIGTNLNCKGGAPINTGSPLACFWHDNYLAGTGVNGNMFLWGCEAHDGGNSSVKLLDNTAQGGGAVGKISVKYWRGQTTGTVVGTLYDWNGVAL